MLVPATAKEVPVEQAVFNEAWKMVKDYHNIEAWGMDTEWEQVVDKAGKIYKLGEGKAPELEALAKNIALAVVEYLELIGKDKGDKEACIAQRMRELEQEQSLQNRINNI